MNRFYLDVKIGPKSEMHAFCLLPKINTEVSPPKYIFESFCSSFCLGVAAHAEISDGASNPVYKKKLI